MYRKTLRTKYSQFPEENGDSPEKERYPTLKIKHISLFMVLLYILLLTACGNSSSNIVTGHYYNPANDSAQTTQSEAVALVEQTSGTETAAGESAPIGTDLFLITNNDMQSECLILEQLASGKQYMYNYSLTTKFLDKYGNRTNVSCFEPGRIITVGKKDIQGRLLEAQISAQAWEYPDVTRYSVDEERGIFQIADTNYSYEEGIFIYSDGNLLAPSDLTDMDTLRVIGIEKKILSVSVTTGHGELKLTNTELFDGSFIQIGDQIFSEITGEMTMEIPEGTYTVAVANNGYGGSTEVTVERGQKTVLDLDTLKGEGPKYGNILFAVDVAGAILQIDGKVVDYSQPISLQYGIHTLYVTAESYEPYSKKLFVNSKEATIVIGLSGEGTQSASSGGTTAETSDIDTSGGAGSLAGSLAGTHGAGSSSDSSTSSNLTDGTIGEAEIDAIVDSLLDEDGDSTSDYLSTITKILSALSDED